MGGGLTNKHDYAKIVANRETYTKITFSNQQDKKTILKLIKLTANEKNYSFPRVLCIMRFGLRTKPPDECGWARDS